MKTNDTRKIKEGDILFSVDPQRLVIATTNVTQVKNGYGKVSVHHTSYLEEEESIPIESFPVECHGLLLFKTQDEAEEFIKTQIGI
ncbi:hypothetical protein CLV62_11081 [Dysgonomonas alginatilytica]|uniref:Uncharacterized protein n=1 Tax=Dysgonomonas alginatilytica TaxID=1605892 RepID=A0A2V3PNR5_9BACT|nr:hypothetical protein [Dysgonomonas alginatilytica]PXV64437.1 hypothetical protein CLV62_11081 [Dysgonomonas alginatilytica]